MASFLSDVLQGLTQVGLAFALVFFVNLMWRVMRDRRGDRSPGARVVYWSASIATYVGASLAIAAIVAIRS